MSLAEISLELLEVHGHPVQDGRGIARQSGNRNGLGNFLVARPGTSCRQRVFIDAVRAGNLRRYAKRDQRLGLHVERGLVREHQVARLDPEARQRRVRHGRDEVGNAAECGSDIGAGIINWPCNGDNRGKGQNCEEKGFHVMFIRVEFRTKYGNVLDNLTKYESKTQLRETASHTREPRNVKHMDMYRRIAILTAKPMEVPMTLPFDGAITNFYEHEAPDDVRRAIKEGDNKDILLNSYPYDRWMKKKDYEEEMEALQLELAKLQADVKNTGKRLVVIFEGRDAAGKGGTIDAMRDNMNPRFARVVALTKPSEREMGEWYFQRYVRELPTAGEIVHV